MKTYRFDQIAIRATDRVQPAETDLEHYVGLTHLDSESLKIRRWGSPADVKGQKLGFRKGDIIFGKRRAYQRKLAVADFDGICSAHAMVLRPKTDVVLPAFLPFFMQSDLFMNRAVEISVGSLSPTINWRTLAAQEFPLPPLDEQRRIAKLLSATERVKQQTQKALQKGWNTRISVYAHLTQKGEHKGALRESYLGEIPHHWTIMKLGDVVNIENHLRKPISTEVRSKMQGSYPYWGATRQLDSINEYRVDGKYALIGEDGDHFLKHSVWSMTHLISGKYNVNNHAHIISGSEHCSTEWFYHFFRHRDIRRWLTKQGSGRLKLKKADLEQMRIILPPRTEQDILVDMLHQAAKATESLEERVKASNSFLKSLIHNSLKVN